MKDASTNKLYWSQVHVFTQGGDALRFTGLNVAGVTGVQCTFAAAGATTGKGINVIDGLSSSSFEDCLFSGTNGEAASVLDVQADFENCTFSGSTAL